jgi:hypothetical protein
LKEVVEELREFRKHGGNVSVSVTEFVGLKPVSWNYTQQRVFELSVSTESIDGL